MIYGHLYFHELNAILIRSAGGLLDFKGFLTCAFIKYIQVFVTVKERYYCYKLSTYCKKKKPAQIFSILSFIKIFDLRKLYDRTKMFEEGDILKKKKKNF